MTIHRRKIDLSPHVSAMAIDSACEGSPGRNRLGSTIPDSVKVVAIRRSSSTARCRGVISLESLFDLRTAWIAFGSFMIDSASLVTIDARIRAASSKSEPVFGIWRWLHHSCSVLVQPEMELGPVEDSELNWLKRSEFS
jgi:hypothetical protein